MFDTTLANLHKPANKAIWFNKPPQIFTVKVAAAVEAVAGLREFCRKQGLDITGAALDKEREGKEALAVVHPLARALVTWFRDKADETNAAKVDLPESGWRRLRDEEFASKARVAHGLAAEIVAGPNSADAAGYNITAAVVATVDKEVEDFEKVLNAPQASIAERKALTEQARAKFNAVELKFVGLDDMILSFSNGAVSQDFIASHKAARIVRDLGGGGSDSTTPTPPSPTPPPA